jgi:glycosyltransferase involved in cell wall biosynthesis
MPSVVVCVTSHNELTKRGEAVLRRSLASLWTAMGYVAKHRPGLDVYVACCDDASTDATPDYIDGYFRGNSWFKLVRNRTNQYAGFSRNVAAAQFATDLICMLDADDEFLEDHLLVCARVMDEVCDGAGRPVLAATTLADFSVPIHPEWVKRLSGTMTITKVIRRDAWEFVEGMPAEAVYRETGCEDQFLIQKLQTFFPIFWGDRVTTRYWHYPGSNFDRQLPKFRAPPRAGMDDGLPSDLMERHRLRERSEQACLLYLREKLHWPGWKQLQVYSEKPASSPVPPI